MARSIFATGHLPPTFALILVAAGLNLLLGEHPLGPGWFLAVAAAWTTGWAALAAVRSRGSLTAPSVEHLGGPQVMNS